MNHLGPAEGLKVFKMGPTDDKQLGQLFCHGIYPQVARVVPDILRDFITSAGDCIAAPESYLAEFRERMNQISDGTFPIDGMDENGETALHVATRHACEHVVNELLGANSDGAEWMTAEQVGLREGPRNPTQIGTSGHHTALLLACQDVESVQVLNPGADDGAMERITSALLRRMTLDDIREKSLEARQLDAGFIPMCKAAFRGSPGAVRAFVAAMDDPEVPEATRDGLRDDFTSSFVAGDQGMPYQRYMRIHASMVHCAAMAPSDVQAGAPASWLERQESARRDILKTVLDSLIEINPDAVVYRNPYGSTGLDAAAMAPHPLGVSVV